MATRTCQYCEENPADLNSTCATCRRAGVPADYNGPSRQFESDTFKLRAFGSWRTVREVERTGKRVYVAFYRRPGLVDATLVKQSDLSYCNDDRRCTAAAVCAPPADECEAAVALLKQRNERTTKAARDQKHKPGSLVWLRLDKAGVKRTKRDSFFDLGSSPLDTVRVRIADPALVAAGAGVFSPKRGEVLVTVPTQAFIDAKEKVAKLCYEHRRKLDKERTAKYPKWSDIPDGYFTEQSAKERTFQEARWHEERPNVEFEYHIVKRSALRLTSKGNSFWTE